MLGVLLGVPTLHGAGLHLQCDGTPPRMRAANPGHDPTLRVQRSDDALFGTLRGCCQLDAGTTGTAGTAGTTAAWRAGGVDLNTAHLHLQEDLCGIERVDGATLSREQFRVRFERPGRPVILTNVLESWPAHAWNAGGSGGGNVTDADQDDAAELGRVLSKVWRRLISSGSCDNRGNNCEEPANLYIDIDGGDPLWRRTRRALGRAYRVPDIFKLGEKEEEGDDGSCHSSTVCSSYLARSCLNTLPSRWWLFAMPGSGSGWHVDPFNTSAWNGVLFGRKRWALSPPSSFTPPGLGGEERGGEGEPGGGEGVKESRGGGGDRDSAGGAERSSFMPSSPSAPSLEANKLFRQWRDHPAAYLRSQLRLQVQPTVWGITAPLAYEEGPSALDYFDNILPAWKRREATRRMKGDGVGNGGDEPGRQLGGEQHSTAEPEPHPSSAADASGHAAILECVVEAGETIYVPSSWWHTVLNLQPSVAVTENMMSNGNAGRVISEMIKRGSPAMGGDPTVTAPALCLSELEVAFPHLFVGG